ncbi:unnamed protein product [Lactuca saligna]|uniref:Uncharacterized protein n=1 Tax=Lactuca saligna TaxID=75948 RepID=A0AA35ZDI3_LACSI|nr:unnamed protein product [Lactuca saligna]
MPAMQQRRRCLGQQPSQGLHFRNCTRVLVFIRSPKWEDPECASGGKWTVTSSNVFKAQTEHWKKVERNYRRVTDKIIYNFHDDSETRTSKLRSVQCVNSCNISDFVDTIYYLLSYRMFNFEVDICYYFSNSESHSSNHDYQPTY